MGKATDYIDLSLIKSQNELAVKLNDLFTLDELKLIDISEMEKKSRDLNQIESVYYTKEFKDSKKSLRIIDTLILDAFPAVRYVKISVNLDNKAHISYICKYSKGIMKFLAITFGKAYNFARWKDTDVKYIKSHIINNFSDKLSTYGESFLTELKFIVQYLIDDGSIANDNVFDYDFNIDKIEFKLRSNDLGVIIFSYKKNVDRDFDSIFVTKNTVGLSNIMLIINKALTAASNKEPS